MKYAIEVFRNTNIGGLTVEAGDEIALIDTDRLPLATVLEAVKSGAAEVVPIKEEAAEETTVEEDGS